MLRLIGSIDIDTDILRLLRSQLRKLYAEACEMQPCNLLIQLLAKSVDTHLVISLPQLDLRQTLIGE